MDMMFRLSMFSQSSVRPARLFPLISGRFYSQGKNDILFMQVKAIFLNSSIDTVDKSNMILDVFEKQNLQTIYDKRYQDLLVNVRTDAKLDPNLVFQLNKIFEVYHQNKQNNDNYRFQRIDTDKDTSVFGDVNKTKKILGYTLTKKQIITIYFSSMSALLVGVTLYGVSNIGIFQLTGLACLVMWVSVVFNPF